jgi:amino acid adenylation domain-containing protein
MTAALDARRLGQLSRDERALLFEKLRARKEAEAPPRTEIPRLAQRPDPLPLSLAQQRLWFLDRLNPGDPAYNILTLVEAQGPLRPEALRRALEAVADRHETLRTTFRRVGTAPAQVVASRPEMALPVVDLSRLGEGSAAEVRRLCHEEIVRPFDLEAGPLLRAGLLRLGPGRHLLLLNLHHIVSDGWSIGILIRETVALYQALVKGEAAALPELPVQYADFAVWQRQWLQGERLAAELAWWRERLQGIEALRLPTDRPRPPRRTSRGATVLLRLAAAPSARLHALAQAEKVTTFIVLLAAFQALLLRYSGQEDLTVGAPVANRNRPEVAGLIGFFINNVVMRGDLSGDPPFRELLARLRPVALQAFAHQELPFEKLVEELRPERDPSRTPLFQVALNLLNTTAPAELQMEIAGLRLTSRRPEIVTAKYDLTLGWAELTQGLGGALEYSRDLFDAATAARMAEHLLNLLQGALDDPGRRLSELPLLAEPEQRQVLEEWNRTAAGPPRRSVLERFEEIAAAHPELPAVERPGEGISYGELDRRADRLARRLRRLGAGPETVVAVLLERSPELAAAQVGVAKSGGAFLPLDPAWPDERLALVLDDAGAAAVLTVERLTGRLPAAVHAVLFDREDEAGDEGPVPAAPAVPAVPAVVIEPENLAYVIYTSGSTGRPKGVAVTRATFANLIDWHHRSWPIAPGERASLVAGPAFDGSVWELWAALAGGATVCVPDEETRLSPPRLAAWLRDERIAHCFLPTPVAESLLALPEAATLGLSALFTGGDRLHRVARRDLPFPVANFYGPTETTVVATCAPAVAGEECDPAVGRPIANARVYVLDGRLRPVPPGVPGELCVGGGILARGYLGRPGATAEAYLPDDFAARFGESGARMYRTGDLARHRPDGQLEVLGRVDRQVKVRGVRIEPGEIEAVLAAHPGVERCAVAVRPDAAGRSGLAALAAYIVPASSDLTAEELRRHLRGALPAPMVPSSLTFLEALPVTANGKVDLEALPAPEAPALAAAYVPPRNDVEKRIAGVWAEVLGVERVGVQDNVFDLGGHSLLLADAQTLLAERLGRDVPLSKLFEHPTVGALALWLAGEEAPSGSAEASRDRARLQRQGLALQRQRLARRTETP